MKPAARKTYIVGVGSTGNLYRNNLCVLRPIAFEKPRDRIGYEELGRQAAVKALLDAGITYDAVEAAYTAYCYGDSTCGQRTLYALGMTQIPIINQNNNCSSGASALYLAHTMVASGVVDCAMALGFEKMAPGSLGSAWDDRTNPLDKTIQSLADNGSMDKGPFAAQIFQAGAVEYIKNNEATWEDVAAIAAKNHTHSKNNAYSQFRNPMTTEEVMNDKKVTSHFTRAMCCPTSDGGACCIVASEDFVHKHKLENQAIEIAALATATDSPSLYEKKSGIELTGADMTRKAARQCFDQTEISVDDVKVVELHDCFAGNELLLYDSLGLCAPGKAHELIRNKDFTYGGKYVINCSGGLESKGHPLGATGISAAFYLICQLRGISGPMQDPRLVPGHLEKQGKEGYALMHNLGLGGSCVVALFKRPSFFKSGGKTGVDRLGYAFGYECKEPTEEDFEKTKSRRAFSEYASARL